MTPVDPASNSIDRKIHFITSNKGQPLLVLNDYVYRCNKKTPKKKYWICTIVGCNVSVQTNIDGDYLSGRKDTHEHAANPELIEVRQTRQQIKQRVINELTPIGSIYDDEMSKTTMASTAVAIFPTISEMCE